MLPRLGLVVFDTADCHFSNPPPTAETVFALHLGDGKLAWIFRPPRPDDKCDFDFGATANAGVSAGGTTTFLGVGAKDGTYYSLDPATGRLRWSTNVVFGGFSGGFVATAAYDGHRVYGSTGHRRLRATSRAPARSTATRAIRSTDAMQEPSVHAFDARNGSVVWQADNAASFSPTTVAGGMTFNGPAGGPCSRCATRAAASSSTVFARSKSRWSGVATVGNVVVLGTGSSYQGSGDGIEVLTPDGTRPLVPAATANRGSRPKGAEPLRAGLGGQRMTH